MYHFLWHNLDCYKGHNVYHFLGHKLDQFLWRNLGYFPGDILDHYLGHSVDCYLRYKLNITPLSSTQSRSLSKACFQGSNADHV